MNREDAVRYAEKWLAFDADSEHIALVRLRHKNMFLPKIGIDGSIRDNSEWALIDMAEKIDTGEYGAVYYFGEKD